MSRVLATVSATASARRPSTSRARSFDWATVTAATPTSTTQMMITWRTSSCPASDRRLLIGPPDRDARGCGGQWTASSGSRPGPTAVRAHNDHKAHCLRKGDTAHASCDLRRQVAVIRRTHRRKQMRIASVRKLSVGIVAAGLVLTGCGTTAEGGSASGSGDDGPISGLRVMVPNSPGSGYDTTARAWAQVLDDEKLADSVEVFNLEGAGGTVGLQRLVNEKGNDKLLMQMGLPVVGAQYSNKSEATLDQTTPIAELIEESEAIVVPADSPYQSISDLVTAWKADPGNTPVGGASNPGGPDHLTPMLLAQEVGVTPSDVNYVAYDGGGELLAGILGGDVKFAATGVGEVTEAAAGGKVRILAVTSAQPVDGVDAPTPQGEGGDATSPTRRGRGGRGGASPSRPGGAPGPPPAAPTTSSRASSTP